MFIIYNFECVCVKCRQQKSNKADFSLKARTLWFCMTSVMKLVFQAALYTNNLIYLRQKIISTTIELEGLKCFSRKVTFFYTVIHLINLTEK